MKLLDYSGLQRFLNKIKTLLDSKSNTGHTHTVSDVSGLSTVATSGDYGDLSNTPTIPTVNNAKLTIQKNGTTVETFTANASSNVTANITVPTAVSELTNDSGFLTSHNPVDSALSDTSTNAVQNKVVKGALDRKSDTGHTHTKSEITDFPTLATVATSGSYNDLSNKPTIPTVNNATLTIQKNGTTVKTFTANASSNVTANITVPTKVSELTNDSGYLTSASNLDSSKLTGTIDIARLPKLSNYVTLNSAQTISGIKTITGGNQGKMVFKNPNYTKGDANESSVTVSRIYFGNSASYDSANAVLSTDINTSGNSIVELAAIDNTASSSTRTSLILTYDKSATRKRLLKSWGDFVPYGDSTYDLGSSTYQWKSVYAQNYYLGTTAFGDIVTHNASEFLTSHQSLSNYVTLDGAQTISGNKTFTGTLTGDITGNCSGSSGSCTGNAATATQFSANKSVTLTGDVTGTTSSKAGWSVATTLANSGVTAGSYGPSDNATPAYGATFNVPYITVDVKGRITAATTKTVKIPASDNTDTKNTAGSTDTSSKIFLVGATSQAANPQTYSHDTAYVGTDGCLYSGGTKVLTAHQSLSNYSTLANTVKSLSISGKTITVTPGSGSAYTLTTQDTVYTHPTTSGNKHIPSGGSSGQFLGWDSDGTAKWVNNPNTNTDTLMTQNVSTTNATYPILLVATADATANQGAKTGIFGSGVKVNPSTSIISASGFSGAPGTNYVQGVKDGGALVNSQTTSFGAVWRAPTKNYQVAGATFPSNNDTVYICYSVTNANVTAGTNTVAKQLTWAADTGTLTANAFSGPLTGNVTGNCSGTSANVTGTVAIANGGTGATTRLNAVKALTNENVGTSATYFITITDSWGKAGYCSVANAKTVLGLGTAAYTASTAYAAASHTHSQYLTAHQSLDSCVKTSGDQDIAGDKRFTSTGITLKNSGFTVGTAPSLNRYWTYFFADSASAGCGRILKYVNKDGSSGIEIQDWKYNNTSTTVTLKVGFNSSGDAYSSSSTTFSAPCLKASTNNASNGIKIGTYTIYVG